MRKRTSSTGLLGCLMIVGGFTAVATEVGGEDRLTPLRERAPAPSATLDVSSQLPENSQVIASKKAIVEGEELILLKVESEAGETTRYIVNSQGQALPESPDLAKSRTRRTRLAPEVKAMLEQIPASSSETIRVDIALRVDTVDDVGEPTSGSEVFATPEQVLLGRPDITVDGQVVSPGTLMHLDIQREMRQDLYRSAHRKAVASTVDTLSRRLRLGRHPAIEAAKEQASGTVTLDLTRRELELLESDPDGIIVGVETASEPVDVLASAMRDTNIDPYALSVTGARGQGIGIYFTEDGCPQSGFVTNYLPVAGAIQTDHSKNVLGILRGVSPSSWVFCRTGYSLPTSTDLSRQPRIRVASNSWASSFDRKYTSRARDWDNFVYNNMVASVFSAGNLATNNPNNNVSAPGLGLNVLTLGAYDDATNAVAGFSSYVNPLIGNAKPEVSAPGVGITAGGFTMSGTSMAAPHAAAFAADLMSAYSSLIGRPHLLKAKMIAGASDPITGGVDKVGKGGIDFYRSVYNGNSYWWSGGNSAFTTWANGDGIPYNNAIDVLYNLNASLSNVRIAIAWLNRGTYTYDHQNDADAIGVDFDLKIYDPSGKLIRSSASFDDPFEFISFDPTVTGQYRIAIVRYANRDTASKIELGMVVDF